MNPPLDLRPSAGVDSDTWTREVFAAGDYAGAARFGSETSLERLIARALLVGDAESLAELAACTEDEARLHHAAALWIHGDDEAATRRLVEIAPRDEHARNLLTMLRKPRIHVLSQLPWLREPRTGMAHAGMSDPRFVIRNIGFRDEGDLPNQPYASVHGFCSDGFRPDFYLCSMVEWHHLPPDLPTLACPLIGQIADHDLHVQTILPWLGAFDELFVTDRTEWLDVQGLSPRIDTVPTRISSFPKSFGISPGATLGRMDPRRRERPLDFFVSGTMLDPFHPDKAIRLHELLSIPNIRMRVVHGFAGEDAYEGLLAASKVSFTFVRRPGATPTRGLEALGMGCALALQEESVLGLWVGEDEGVRTYSAEPGALAACVQELLAGWDEHYQDAALRGAAKIRRAFDRERVASQYLRFAAFRAAAPRPLRDPFDLGQAVQKRVSVRRAWVPPCPIARKRTMQANFRFLQRRAARAPDPDALNVMSRELLLEYAFWVGEPDQEPETALLTDALRLLDLGCRQFPDHLVLRFNRIRAAFEYGDDAAKCEAMHLAHEALEADEARWQLDSADDVLSFDFGPDAFNYRDYLTAVTDHARGRVDLPTTRGILVRLIRASIAGYFARKTGRLDVHAEATRLDPGFARYAMDHARARFDAGPKDPEELASLAADLERLARGSTSFVEASEMLERLRIRPDAPPPTGELSADVLARTLERMRCDHLDARLDLRHLANDDTIVTTNGPTAEVGVVESSVLGVLVPFAGSARELADLVNDIQNQTIAHRVEIFVALPPGVLELEQIVAAHDGSPCRVRVVPVSLEARFGDALGECVERARGIPILTVASPGVRRRADAFEKLTDPLLADARAHVAFANEGRTDGPPTSFDPSRCSFVLCLPRFGRRRAFACGPFGFHPVWRSSLHDRFGTFDASYGAATEYEFFLRCMPWIEVVQRREMLSVGPADSRFLAARDPERDVRAISDARSARWPEAWGAMPSARACRPLPASLFNPALEDEARSHYQLGIIPFRARQEVRALQSIYGAALIERDLDTAERMLRTAVERHPTLLSARMLHARILESMDLRAVPEALEHILRCNPYPAAAQHIVGHACARIRPALA